ncbi:MAG: hypothetical protein AAF969_14000 [Bacteroidota bacterium]
MQVSLAQKNVEQVVDSYSHYFELARESLFLHTNKTSYLPGETIWFSSYLVNRKENVLFGDASSLTCTLFDDNGKKIESFVIPIEKGVGSGHVDLPKTISSGSVYLKAQSKWMDNFKEDGSFTAVLQIIEPSKTSESTETSTNISSPNRIFIMPEGGHLVANTLNTVGIKFRQETNNNPLTQLGLFSGDGKELINTININEQGIGRFEFTPLKGHNYYLKAKDAQGKNEIFPLESAKNNGLTLSVNNLFDDRLIVQVKTNEETLEDIRGSDHFVAIHRDGLITFKTFQIEDIVHTIRIPKNQLLSGINIVTVFDNNLNPILERLVFNENDLKTTRASITKVANHKEKDSIALKINLFSKSKSKGILSVSVLPEETKSKNIDQSILSTFYIQPYLDHGIMNIGQLMRDMDRNKKYALDLTLLAEGWSQYDWDNIFDSPPEQKYYSQSGFRVSGKVWNSKPEKNKFMTFYQQSHPWIRQVEIDPFGSFSIENAFVHKNEKVYAALLNKRNKTQEPKVTFHIEPLESPNKVSISKDFLSSHGLFASKSEIDPIPQPPTKNLSTNDKTIILKEVVVSEEKIENKLVHKPSQINDVIFDGLKITKEEVRIRPTLQQILQKFGYRTMTTPAGGAVILPRSADPTILPPAIIVDGITMYNPSRGIDNLPPDLLNSNTGGIDEIYYTHQPVEFGNRPAIYIYRKYGALVGQKPEERFASFVAKEGFQRPKKFYQPQNYSYSSQQFKFYGAIHWEEQITTKENGEALITIPKLEQKGGKIHIEGITEDGSLISEFQTVSFE